MQNNYFLSIIIPCFNSEKTVRQTVESVFKQEINIPFEIVMVNDGSTDSTPAIIKELKSQHAQIVSLSHEENMGGGKSRNDAIKKSQGNLIFCLDSDDLLPPSMIMKLVNYLDVKKGDGVVFSETKYFMWSPKITRTLSNSFNVDNPITFKDLFSKETSFFTQVNFLYTRAAYDRIGGYPENHGFDTQGFGFHFLAKGNTAYMCPKSFYYHRQGVGKSYFEREYETGRLSLNYYLILEDMLYLFSDRIIYKIFNYDVFLHCNLTSDNLMSLIKSELNSSHESILSGAVSWKERISFINKKKKKLFSDTVLLGVHQLILENYKVAYDIFMELYLREQTTPLLIYTLLRCLSGMRNDESFDIEQLLGSIALRPQISEVSQALPLKIARNVVHIVRNQFNEK